MNGNVIKAVACLSMLLDHIGYLLFPQAEWLRWCGRLALPLFAYLVAEGCPTPVIAVAIFCGCWVWDCCVRCLVRCRDCTTVKQS